MDVRSVRVACVASRKSVIHVTASEDDPGYKTTPEKTVKVAGPYLFIFDSECYKEVRAREKGQRRTRMNSGVLTARFMGGPFFEIS